MIEKDYVGDAMKQFFKDRNIDIGELDYQPDGEVKVKFMDGNITMVQLSDFESHFKVQLGSYSWDGDKMVDVDFYFEG